MRPWRLLPMCLFMGACFGVPGLSCGPAGGKCTSEPGPADPELASRGDEILKALAKDFRAITTLSTAPLAKTLTPDKVQEAATQLAVALSSPRTLERLWRWRGIGGFAACEVKEGVVQGFEVAPGPREAAVLFYEIPGDPLALRLLLELHREQGEVRVHSLRVFPRSHRGWTAAGFAAVAEDYAADGDELSATFALIAGENLSRFPQHMKMQESLSLEKKWAAFMTKERMGRILAVERLPRAHPWLNLAMEPSEEFGLMPVISFVSGDADQERAARDLFERLGALTPGLRAYFARVSLRAYREPPIDPKRRYEFRATVIPLTPR
jgi:hypothetical protein